MKPKKTAERRKCVVCWSWYRPHAAATRTQRVCSDPECRRVHRNRLAQARRREDLARFRIAERRRQRRRRRAKLADAAGVSRATLSPKSLGIIDESIAKLADEQAMSRARLRRHLIRVTQMAQQGSGLADASP